MFALGVVSYIYSIYFESKIFVKRVLKKGKEYEKKSKSIFLEGGGATTVHWGPEFDNSSHLELDGGAHSPSQTSPPTGQHCYLCYRDLKYDRLLWKRNVG